jgi:aspartyl-tRNA synthetase
VPFPKIAYKDAMEKYKTDRPDLRKDKNDKDLLAFCWVVNFPFFEKTDDGGWTFTHNPFSAAKPEFAEYLIAKKNIDEILTSQYDVGYKKEVIQEKFGHILEAFKYGAPPHGGIAWGLDRVLALLIGEPNIREVIAFPKTGDGRDFMMGAPCKVDKKQLEELNIKVSLVKKHGF